ncbi:MAG: hypothetical protein ACR2N0_09135 [Rubrobacteraceae bacterium]|jgi:hypothetical protein|nr:hypothetical protein [Rubrobacter sp.]
MSQFAGKTTVKIHAHSPGGRSILIVETPDGKHLSLHAETGYDLEKGKPVEEAWVKDNAIGRHSFIEVSPPEEVEASELPGYAG